MIRLRQVCFAAPKITSADELSEIFGVPIAYRDPLIDVFGLENALLGFGGTFVEFIAPLEGSTATTATRFLARKPGGGGYMVIHDTDEYETIRKRIDANGVRVAFESTPELRDPSENTPENAYDSFRNVQLDPRSVGGTLMEFNATANSEDLFGSYGPAGGDGWQSGISADLPKMVGTECTTADPQKTAAAWAALMDKPVAQDNGQPIIHLDDGGFDRFVAGDSETFSRLFIDTTEPEAVLERARAKGYDVTDSQFAFCGVDIVVVPR